MKKIFTLFLGLCACTLVMAQRPEAVIAKAGEVKPVIDGVLDDVWANVEAHNVDQPFGSEVPSLGEEGEVYWKALWDETGLYIIVVTNDDVWHPYTGTGNAWEFDKIELYFDTNYILEDGVGGQGGTTGNRQIAPDPTLTKLAGEVLTQTIQGGTVQYAYKVENPAWTTEWFVPWESIPDKDGNVFDITGTMGFDVSISDNDNDGSNRKRALWSNVGKINENWNNMDDAGYVTLEGVGEAIDIDAITISGEQTITTDNGTIQLNAALLPADATQAIKWQITNGTGMATVSKTGLVTGLRNGTVTVKAVSANDFISSNELTITISGQKIALGEVNFILNSYFEDGTANWGGAGVVEDSYYNIECTPKANIWDTMFGQPKLPIADNATKYIVRFKAKASAEMTVPTLMEDRNNSNNKTVSSSSPWRGSERWEIPITTEPAWYEFDVTFSNKQDNSAYELNFQVGMVTGTFSIDSIMMFSEADLALVDPTAGLNTVDGSSLNVYPNPVNNTLFVELSDINAKVAIYNSVGQKLMEKTATSNRVQFDVSALRKGMYIVRLSDGTSRKFVK